MRLFNFLGYIMVEVEQYGFDEYVNIIVQPRGKFVNYVPTKSAEGVKVFENVKFGTILFAPAESNIFVQYAPAYNTDKTSKKENYMGRFRMRAKYEQYITEEYRKASNVQIVERADYAAKKNDLIGKNVKDKTSSDT